MGLRHEGYKVVRTDHGGGIVLHLHSGRRLDVVVILTVDLFLMICDLVRVHKAWVPVQSVGAMVKGGEHVTALVLEPLLVTPLRRVRLYQARQGADEGGTARISR